MSYKYEKEVSCGASRYVVLRFNQDQLNDLEASNINSMAYKAAVRALCGRCAKNGECPARKFLDEVKKKAGLPVDGD